MLGRKHMLMSRPPLTQLRHIHCGDPRERVKKTSQRITTKEHESWAINPAVPTLI